MIFDCATADPDTLDTHVSITKAPPPFPAHLGDMTASAQTGSRPAAE